MAVKDLLPALVAAVGALPSGPTRLDDDFGDLEDIAPGATRFQMTVEQIGQVTGSEQKRAKVGVRVWVRHRLADPADPRAYTQSTMLDDQQQLYDFDFWDGITGVYGAGDPTPAEQVQKRGAVVTYAVNVELEAAL